MSVIRAQLMTELKAAMKDKDQVKLDTIRFLQSAIKYREIELRPAEISDDEILAVIRKLVKQRKESIEQFQQAGRNDLAEKESSELKLLEHYLPAQMSAADLEKIVVAAIQTTGAKSPKEMGLVIKEVAAKSQGRADNKMISELVKAKLQNP